MRAAYHELRPMREASRRGWPVATRPRLRPGGSIGGGDGPLWRHSGRVTVGCPSRDPPPGAPSGSSMRHEHEQASPARATNPGDRGPHRGGRGHARRPDGDRGRGASAALRGGARHPRLPRVRRPRPARLRHRRRASVRQADPDRRARRAGQAAQREGRLRQRGHEADLHQHHEDAHLPRPRDGEGPLGAGLSEGAATGWRSRPTGR